MDMTVKLQVFEGPLDLLLHLLDKNKVNIYDIPIVEITNQYMEYIAEMKRRDLNILSEFLVMAATLIDIKSKMLLPSTGEEEDEEEDPRNELVQQLLEYKMYKCMAYELKDRQLDASRVLFKEPTIPDEVLAYEEPIDMDALVADVTLAKLNEIFKNIMKKQVDPRFLPSSLTLVPTLYLLPLAYHPFYFPSPAVEYSGGFFSGGFIQVSCLSTHSFNNCL